MGRWGRKCAWSEGCTRAFGNSAKSEAGEAGVSQSRFSLSLWAFKRYSRSSVLALVVEERGGSLAHSTTQLLAGGDDAGSWCGLAAAEAAEGRTGPPSRPGQEERKRARAGYHTLARRRVGRRERAGNTCGRRRRPSRSRSRSSVVAPPRAASLSLSRLLCAAAATREATSPFLSLGGHLSPLSRRRLACLLLSVAASGTAGRNRQSAEVRLCGGSSVGFGISLNIIILSSVPEPGSLGWAARQSNLQQAEGEDGGAGAGAGADVFLMHTGVR